MEDVIWKPVVGFEGSYEVSNLGEIRSVARISSYHDPRWNTTVTRAYKSCIIKQNNVSGYKFIGLYKGGKLYQFYVHRLVAQAFIPNPENKPEVNHKDRNRHNNCVDNLEWVTAKENSQHLLHSDYDWGASHRGKHLSEEHKQKLSKFFKGRKHTNHLFTQDSLNKMLQSRKCNPVCCLSDNKVFRSATNAASYYNCNADTVLKSIRSNKPTRKGLQFTYYSMEEYYK